MSLTYTDGYRSGQHDVLTWLTVSAGDDVPLAPFDEQVQFRAALFCLAHNLGIAGALCEAFRYGRARAFDESARLLRYETSVEWYPGCGRSASL